MTAQEALVVPKARAFRQRLTGSGLLRVAGVYDGFTALLAERHDFGALWLSGLGASAMHGLPDASLLSMAEFLDAARLANRSSRLPVVADCDTGFGDVNNVVHLVREYESAGIAAVCLEDKEFPKRNSFARGHQLADPRQFAAKVMAAKQAQTDPAFTVIARLESLVVGAGEDDALARARMYQRAGADAILVHSRAPEPTEVLSFARRFRESSDAPLVVIPTTYPQVVEADLVAAGVSAVIYANQVLRAFAAAAEAVLAAICRDGSAAAVEGQVVDVRQVLELLGTDRINATDTWFAEAVRALDADPVGPDTQARPDRSDADRMEVR